MALPYELLKDAEADLREVARYTLKKWGKEALANYRGGINKVFIGIGNGEVVSNAFSSKYPHLLVTKYKYHYIFYITVQRENPLIIGVIHEKRDIVNRLSERLS